MERIIVPSDTMRRAQMRIEQAEAIIAAFASTYERFAAVFKRTLAVKGRAALATRRA